MLKNLLLKLAKTENNYKVYRDDIYVGQVVKPSGIDRYDNDCRNFMTGKDMSGLLHANSWFSYRSMLFVPNEQKLSGDLLYQSPNYPILNISDDNDCFSNSIVIMNAYNLAPLLKYFDYNEELSLEDVIMIRKIFFNGTFGKDNCELFGFKEIQPEDLTFFENGKEITDLKKLKKYIKQARLDQKRGYRSFCSGIESYPLPAELMTVLDQFGDKSFGDFLLDNNNMNAFKPHKEEGQIKKLGKF